MRAAGLAPLPAFSSHPFPLSFELTALLLVAQDGPQRHELHVPHLPDHGVHRPLPNALPCPRTLESRKHCHHLTCSLDCYRSLDYRHRHLYLAWQYQEPLPHLGRHCPSLLGRLVYCNRQLHALHSVSSLEYRKGKVCLYHKERRTSINKKI